MSKPVLIIEMDPAELNRWRQRIESRGFFSETVFAGDLAQATQLWAETDFRVVILGQHVSSAEDTAILDRLAAKNSASLVLVFRDAELFQKPILFRGRPCPSLATHLQGETLEWAIRSALLLDDWRQNRRLTTLMERMTRLPSIPSLYVEVCQKLQSSESSLEDVAVHISHDLAMCATLLRIVNSTAFALARQITTAFEAVMFLGAAQTKSLILFSQLFSKFNGSKARSFSMDEFWLHSVGVANIARWIAREETGDITHGDEAYTAGLLHDVGRLLLADNLPELTDRIAAGAAGKGKPVWQSEQEVLGATHAEIGAYLLANWGLPYPILDAIGYHHNPQQSAPDGFTTLTAVHAANVLDYEKRFDAASRATKTVDTAYLRSIFTDDPMIKWRSLAGITTSG
jgi:putative nucleotidyltransferase with HDIG domain